MRAFSQVSALLLVASLFAACGDDNSTVISPTRPSPATTTFASSLPVGGAVSRSVTAIKSGTLTVTLNSAGAPGTVVGFGLGIPFGGVSNCSLTTSMRTAAGPGAQLAATVDAGSYCVTAYDVGTLTDPISFDITIVYP